MLAEMMTGNLETADWFFFIAMVLFILSALFALTGLTVPPSTASRFWSPFLAAGAACTALALWVL